MIELFFTILPIVVIGAFPVILVCGFISEYRLRKRRKRFQEASRKLHEYR